MGMVVSKENMANGLAFLIIIKKELNYVNINKLNPKRITINYV